MSSTSMLCTKTIINKSNDGNQQYCVNVTEQKQACVPPIICDGITLLGYKTCQTMILVILRGFNKSEKECTDYAQFQNIKQRYRDIKLYFAEIFLTFLFSQFMLLTIYMIVCTVCVLTFIHTYNRFPACVKAGFAMLV